MKVSIDMAECIFDYALINIHSSMLQLNGDAPHCHKLDGIKEPEIYFLTFLEARKECEISFTEPTSRYQQATPSGGSQRIGSCLFHFWWLLHSLACGHMGLIWSHGFLFSCVS